MQVVSLEPEIRWMPQWSVDKQVTIGLPMCRMCCPTVLPFTRDVTRRLLSQWPPLNSSLPSWDATNSPAVTSTPGAKGPESERWVLGPGRVELVGVHVLLHLDQLTGRLPEVADHALQGLALLFVRDGVQVHRACNTTPGQNADEAQRRGGKGGFGCFTLVCAVVEDVEGLHRRRAPLLVAEDQIDPLVEVRRHVLRLLW
ncbi:hypothetical protein EYF80_062567 [Liparis tanakae]|uniref:Uncharacterized protein n=1 Tax=Liparis tanakae TaxID=230148 RepID=A0A4Z2EEX5_9TELE|nr:hypothetical protein EYF80_062567 [Liparis tanakae]